MSAEKSRKKEGYNSLEEAHVSQRYPKIAKFCFVLPVEEEDVKGMYSILSLLLHSDQKIRSLIISPADFKEALGV